MLTVNENANRLAPFLSFFPSWTCERYGLTAPVLAHFGRRLH
jgi:hypothetical protein